MLGLIKPFLPMILAVIASTATMVVGRNIKQELKNKNPIFAILSLAFLLIGVVYTVWTYYDFFLDKFYPKSTTSLSSEIPTVQDGNIIFPYKGKIVNWHIYFEFITECENDHYATLTSPAGRVLTVMYRGLHRCTGVAETYTSNNDNEVGVFMGTDAKGIWKFVMSDLDRNDYTGTLIEFWMKIAVSDNGAISEHKVSLGGLPRAIPATSN
jgi:hypothetical protein